MVMNGTRWLGLGLSVLLIGRAAGAEEAKVLYSATVAAAEAEVRSGAGATPQLYPTNKLRKGDRVEVVKEVEGGWLAIKPPPGSFSWINARFLQPAGPGWYYVVGHPETRVPLLIGSQVIAEKPSVEGVRVRPGHLLKGMGAMHESPDGKWLPVEPPPSEVRYIRAEAVSRQPGDAATAVAPGVPPAPAPSAPPASPPTTGGAWTPGNPPATPPTTTADGQHPLWQQAQQAEQAGHYAEAIQLYRQLGAEVANSNHNLSVQAYNRAQWVSDAMYGKSGSPSTSTTSRSAPQPGPTPPAGTVSSGPGWLRRAGRSLDLNMMYVLENSQGKPVIYAVALPGYTLSPYENRNVELYGTSQYRADLRAYYMTVVQVRPLQ
jgi:hypothetical protein